MPCLPWSALTLVCAGVLSAAAQTQTIPNPNGNGGSIVEVVTTDINGLPVTNVVQTIPPGVTTAPNPGAVPTTTTPVAVGPVPTTTRTMRTQTTTPGNLGPVPQPAPTLPPGEGITTYQYTTVDGLGQTQVIQDTFTPTYNTPSPQGSPAKGTILSPSDFSAMIGTHTAGGPTSGVVSWRITPMGVGGMIALICGAVVGALTVL